MKVAETARAKVVAVSRAPRHGFSKTPDLWITLSTGLGVEGDAHRGETVRHRYDVRRDPTRPNLRQVHLFQGERLDALRAAGFPLAPGEMGENVLTKGLDLPALPLGTRLFLGASAVVELTGLRAPCALMDRHRNGLKTAVATTGGIGGGRIGGGGVGGAGVMAIVLAGGEVRADDPIGVEPPLPPHRALRPI